MSNRFCSLFLVFCLVFATLVRSGYGGRLAAVNSQVSIIQVDNFIDEPLNDGFPLEGHHEEETFQVIDLLETEPHPNNTSHIFIYADFNGNDNYFEFINSCITWHSDNTSPPPEA